MLPLSIARNIVMPLRVTLGLSADEAHARLHEALREAQAYLATQEFHVEEVAL
mgnify:CR=1 FL=1